MTPAAAFAWPTGPYLALVTLPFFMQRVQTHMRRVLPLPSVTRTDWRFGRNRRLVMPVVWRPMPPLYLGEPLRTTTLPTEGPLPQISQTLDIFLFLSMVVVSWPRQAATRRSRTRSRTRRKDRQGSRCPPCGRSPPRRLRRTSPPRGP